MRVALARAGLHAGDVAARGRVRCSRNQSHPLGEARAGGRSRSSSSTSQAKSGMRPTIERRRIGTWWPSTMDLVVVEAVLLVPQPGPAERRSWRPRSRRSARRTWRPRPRRPGPRSPARARSRAWCRSRTPSTRCRRPARAGRRRAAAGSGRTRRCCRGRGTRRRRGCLPSTSLRFTHQVKLRSSFWKTRSRNSRSRVAAPAGHLVDAPGGPRVHGRVHVVERPLVRRDAARSGACTTRAAAARSCSLANSGSTVANGSMWNARSHAANHGYSHLSGIEITSRAWRCGQSPLRPRRRARGRRGLRGVALEPLLTRRSGRTASTTAAPRTPGGQPGAACASSPAGMTPA